MISTILLSLLLSFSVIGHSSEVDSFTDRNEALSMKNSLSVLNEFVRARLKHAVVMANKQEKNCVVKKLKKEVLVALSSTVPIRYPTGALYFPEKSYGVHGYLETAVDEGHDPTGHYKFQVMNTKKERSIYQDITKLESLPVNKVIGKVVRIMNII